MKNNLTNPITEDKIKSRTSIVDGTDKLTKSISDVYSRIEKDAKNRNLKMSSDDTLNTQRLLNTAGYTDLQGKNFKRTRCLAIKPKLPPKSISRAVLQNTMLLICKSNLTKTVLPTAWGNSPLMQFLTMLLTMLCWGKNLHTATMERRVFCDLNLTKTICL